MLAYHRKVQCETIPCLCKSHANFSQQNRDRMSIAPKLGMSKYYGSIPQIYSCLGSKRSSIPGAG